MELHGGIRVLVDYKDGGPKVLWIKVKQKKHWLWYLRALRLAVEHGKVVPHLSNEGFYEELVTGKIKMKRAPRFKFQDGVDAKKSRPARKLRRVHQKLPHQPAVEDLPSLDALEEWNPSEAYLAEVRERLARVFFKLSC